MAAVEMTVSSLDKVEAVVRNSAIYELARVIPERQPGEAGRPFEFPTYMPFIFEALISVYGSARKVDAELQHRYVWKMIRRRIKKMFPNDKEMWLPSFRFRRYHYTYFRNRYMTNPAIFEQIQEVHRRIAAEQARELGLLDPEGEGSLTHPSLDRLLYADGKVVAPLYKAKPGDTRVDKETGEIKPIRFEADADLHFQGDGETAYGVKFVMTAVRSKDVHGRIVLDAGWVPEKGNEAKIAMQSFKNIAPHVPGAQGCIYDTALRGAHHVELMQELGWLSINRIQAAEVVKKDGRQVKRVEKTTHIEDKQVDGKTVRLYARGGAVCTAEFTETGEQILTELRRVRTMRHADKTGRFRFYNEYELANGRTITVRLDTTEEDRKRKFNRSENVRQIAPNDPDFMRVYRRRSDIESINRVLDDTMWLGRAHSKGHARQLMNIIGFALVTNGLAIHLHRKRLAAEAKESNAAPGAAAA